MEMEAELYRRCGRAAGAMIAARQYGFSPQDISDLTHDIYQGALPRARRCDVSRASEGGSSGLTSAWLTMSIEQAIRDLVAHRSCEKRHWSTPMLPLDDRQPDRKRSARELRADLSRVLASAAPDEQWLAQAFMAGWSRAEARRSLGLTKRHARDISKRLRATLRCLEEYIER